MTEGKYIYLVLAAGVFTGFLLGVSVAANVQCENNK